jgi:hypothetical protein
MIKDEELKQKSIMHNPLDFSGKVTLVTVRRSRDGTRHGKRDSESRSDQPRAEA